MTQRVTVTRPRAREGHHSAPGRPDHGEFQVRALMRRQGRLTLVTCALVALILGGLPLLFAWLPRLSQVRLLGIRLPWLVLCGGVQPVLVAVACRHLRRAEDIERHFIGPARHE